MTDGTTSMYMPVAPAYGGNYGGNGMFGGDGWWLILLLLCFGNNGWGFGGNGMNTNNDVQRGFDQNAVMNGITGVQNAVTNGFSSTQTALCNGFGNVQTALCNGFAGVQNGFAQAEIANNARQMADMQQTFANQTATMQGFNATQTTAMQNTRDILESGTRNTQAILDKLCALELDGVKGQLAQAQRENVDLQNQLNMAALRESQTAQNAFIAQGFSNEVDALYNRLNNCPVPSTPVYGRTPIFTCNNNGCGCGVA